ncbi:MAG: hypothetical protein WCI17_00910 [bacterium]
MVDRLGLRMALVLTLALVFVLYAANLWFGLLNQDEGWYLYAALETTRGHMPYRDFFFTQGPVLPVVYGWLAPLWSPFGVAGGRALTALLGLTGGVLAAILAARVVARGQRLAAGILVLAFTAANVYHSYFTTIPKTYALAACLLLGGYLVLTLAGRPGRAGLAAVAGVLLAGAAGARLSLGALLAVTGFWLLWQRRTFGWAWLWFGLGGAAGLTLIYGPSLMMAREQFLFANTFHTARDGGRDLLFMAGSISRSVRGYLPLALVAVALAAWRIWSPRRAEPDAGSSGPSWATLWLASFAFVFAAQLMSPYPYDDYQVPVMPLLAAVVAVCTVRATAPALRPALVWVAVAGAALAAFSSPINQEWFILRQDRFWVVKRTPSDLVKLRQAGRQIRELLPAGQLLLTQDTYLAVEACRRVPAGMEMGPFGYFPELDDAAAARCHVLNRAGMLRTLRQTDAPVAAFSGYALAIGAPAMRELSPDAQAELWQVVADRYDQIDSIPDFGQGATRLGIWSLRAEAETFNAQRATPNVQPAASEKK